MNLDMKAAIATSSAEPPVAEVMQRLLDKYARMRGRAASVHAGTRRAQPRSEPATKSHVSVIFCPPAIFQHPDTAVQVVCGLR